MIKYLFFGVFLFSNLLGVKNENFPSPYNSVEILPFCSHGWFANGTELESLIIGRNVKTVVEVGSWMGLSTRFIASTLPNDGKVYAVDHWLGSEEHQLGESAHHYLLPNLYEQFLSNVIHAGLTDKIIPIRMSSLEAAQQIKGICSSVIDLVYIDASHDTESVYADLMAWYPYVQGHGILCGDDWHWGPVQIAVKRFAEQIGLNVVASGYFWSLQEAQQ